ncbi:MAG: response regulator [bacterium]|nr:response regulator [bacterium]
MKNLNKKKILIADDEKDIRTLVSQILGEENYKIYFAKNGREAIDAANENMPDLLILDLMMPEIDGIEVCKCLKQNKNTKKIPIIMLTAKTGVADKIEGFVTGADEYITKPFDPLKLEIAVEKVLRRAEKDNR